MRLQRRKARAFSYVQATYGSEFEYYLCSKFETKLKNNSKEITFSPNLFCDLVISYYANNEDENDHKTTGTRKGGTEYSIEEPNETPGTDHLSPIYPTLAQPSQTDKFSNSLTETTPNSEEGGNTDTTSALC